MIVVIFIITGFYGMDFWSRDASSITLTRSAACRTFVLGSRGSYCHRIGEDWMDQREYSKRRLKRYFHDIWSGGSRVQYIHEVGVYVTLLSISHVLPANVVLLNFKTAIQTFTRVADRPEKTRLHRCCTCFHSRGRWFCRYFGYRTQAWKTLRSSTPSRWCRSCVPGVLCSRIKWVGSSLRTSPRPNFL